MNAFWQLLIVMTVAELASSLATMIDGIILSRYLGENAIAVFNLNNLVIRIDRHKLPAT